MDYAQDISVFYFSNPDAVQAPGNVQDRQVTSTKIPVNSRHHLCE